MCHERRSDTPEARLETGATESALTERDGWILQLILITALAAVLRIYALGKISIWYDEGGTLLLIKHIDTSLRFFSDEVTVEMPLFPIIVCFWKNAFETISGFQPGSVAYDYWLRLPPCIISIASVPLIFFTTNTIVKDKRTGLLTAFLFAISPFQIYYAQELRAFSLHVFLLTASLYFMLKALETDRRQHWVAMVLFMTLCIYNHSSSMWVLATMNLFYLLTIKSNYKHIYKWFFSQCSVGILCILPLRTAYIVGQYMGNATHSFYPDLPLKTPLLTYKAFFAGYSPSIYAYKGLCVLVAILLLVGSYKLLKKRYALLLLLILAVLPVIIEFVLWRARTNNLWYWHRHLIFSSIPCYILAAYGIRKLPYKTASIIAIALMTVFTIPCLADHYAQRLHPIELHWRGARYKVDSRSAANHIKQDLKHDDIIMHTSSVSMAPFKSLYLEHSQCPQPIVCFTEQDRLDSLLTFPHRKMWEYYDIFPIRINPLLQQNNALLGG